MRKLNNYLSSDRQRKAARYQVLLEFVLVAAFGVLLVPMLLLLIIYADTIDQFFYDLLRALLVH